MTQEALKLAIQLRDTASGYWTENEIPIIEKLIELLAQPEQEPVADDIASILTCRDMLDAQPVPEVGRVIWPEHTEPEPVGVVHHKLTSTLGADYEQIAVFIRPVEPGTKLYTTPPQRKPLTFAGQSISEIRLANGLIARFVKDILIVEFD